MINRLLLSVAVALLINGAHGVTALQTIDDSLPRLDSVCQGLDYPTAITLHPLAHYPIVANSGAGTVIAVVDGQVHELIRGFPVEKTAVDDHGVSGPTCLATLTASGDTHLLVVGTSGEGRGVDHVSAFVLIGKSSVSLENPLDADGELFGRTLNTSGEYPALGDFRGIASFGETVWFTTRGEDSAGWIGEFEMAGGSAGKCRRFFKTATPEKPSVATAIGFSPDGLLVVASHAAGAVGNDSLLRFYEIEEGQLCATFATDLVDVVAIGWSPHDRNLYALASGGDAPDPSGLYRITARNNQRQCHVEKVLEIAHPAGMCFADDGRLWVTSHGPRPQPGSGELLLISNLKSGGPVNLPTND
jgi:hypothetical protein